MWGWVGQSQMAEISLGQKLGWPCKAFLPGAPQQHFLCLFLCLTVLPGWITAVCRENRNQLKSTGLKEDLGCTAGKHVHPYSNVKDRGSSGRGTIACGRRLLWTAGHQRTDLWAWLFSYIALDVSSGCGWKPFWTSICWDELQPEQVCSSQPWCFCISFSLLGLVRRGLGFWACTSDSLVWDVALAQVNGHPLPNGFNERFNPFKPSGLISPYLNTAWSGFRQDCEMAAPLSWGTCPTPRWDHFSTQWVT